MIHKSPCLQWIALLFVLLLTLPFVEQLAGQDDQRAEEPAGVVSEADPQAETDDATEGSPSSENAANESLGNSDSLLAMIYDSGITGIAFMGVLALFSLVAGTVALERAVNMRRENIIPAAFIQELKQVGQNLRPSLEPLKEICQSSQSPVATIVQAGIMRSGCALSDVEKSMEDAAVREMSEIQAKIRPLRTVGSVAPLVGLLGTVVGMIIAFHTASQAGLGKAELLAKGIYMALLTTAGGLSVAIPALLLGSYFSGRVEKYFRQMDKFLVALIPLLADSAAVTPATQGESSPRSASPQDPTSIPSTNPLMKA